MAFNLYCNGTPSVYDYDDAEEQLSECKLYSVEDLFCCGYALFFWQAIQICYGWFDEENRAYIHYTVENIMEDLGCAKATCVKVIAELDSKKGIGLIEKKRQGLV